MTDFQATLLGLTGNFVVSSMRVLKMAVAGNTWHPAMVGPVAVVVVPDPDVPVKPDDPLLDVVLPLLPEPDVPVVTVPAPPFVVVLVLAAAPPDPAGISVDVVEEDVALLPPPPPHAASEVKLKTSAHARLRRAGRAICQADTASV